MSASLFSSIFPPSQYILIHPFSFSPNLDRAPSRENDDLGSCSISHCSVVSAFLGEKFAFYESGFQLLLVLELSFNCLGFSHTRLTPLPCENNVLSR